MLFIGAMFLASCGTLLKGIFSSTTPEQKAASNLVRTHKKSLRLLQPCLVGHRVSNQSCFSKKNPTRAVDAAKAIAASCTAGLRADTVSIKEHRRLSPKRKFPAARTLRIGAFDEYSASQICAYVEGFSLQKAAKDAIRLRLEAIREAAKESFELVKSKLEKDPNHNIGSGGTRSGGDILTKWLHPDLDYFPKFKKWMIPILQRAGVEQMDESALEPLRNDIAQWAKTLIGMAGTPRLDKDELRYPHILRTLKKDLRGTKLKMRVIRISCESEWDIHRSRIGVITSRTVSCNYAAKVSGESGCRAFRLVYEEEYVGRRFRKAKHMHNTDRHYSRPVQCR